MLFIDFLDLYFMLRNNRVLDNSNSSISVIPLGGVDGIGSNCTLIEYRNKIFIIDMGLGFPDGDMYGIDFLIPNIDYLKKNIHKIQGIFITHGHLDHIGALPYTVEALNYPKIYGSKFTLEVVKNNFQRHELDRIPELEIVDSTTNLVFEDVRVNFFRVNHSIPEALGIIVKTPEGNIVHTGDFKFDNSPTMEPVAEYDKIAQVGSQGVLALLSDSTNSFKPGHSLSEQQIMANLQNAIEAAKGRVIVATFASLVFRVIQLIEIAKRTNRKVAIAGRSMQKLLEVSQKMGYLGDLKQILIETRAVEKTPDNKVMVIATGAQGEEMAALSRIINGTHQDISVHKGDTIILSASVIPGNDADVQHMVDELSIQGAIVYHTADDMDLHTSGHGHQEDQKIMINLVKPKYFIPAHGYQSFLYKHAQTAMSVGMKEKNIIIPRRGDVIKFSKGGYEVIKNTIKTNPVLISGAGVGDIGEIVLSERQQLGNNGVVIYSAVISKSQNKLINNPSIYTKGFTYFNDNTELFEILNGIGQELISSALAEGNQIKDLRDKLKDRFQRIIYKEMEREPLVLILLHEIA